tara:strand:+ start:11748 stop:12596 length:849 start_codon:yes stop_codon:yes gene_type:complete
MLLEILETFNYEPQLAMPFPLVALLGIGAQAFSGIMASNKAKKAKADAKKLQDQLTDLENSRQNIYNASQDIKDLAGQITNPYANLPVATQAAEMQAEQADLALANTLDSMQAGGFGSGGATALAQAAARSKRGISANIEQQEARNNRLKAQGEVSVQAQKLQLEQAAIGAEGRAWQQQENRELMQLDRNQALIDNQTAQQMQYQQDAMGAFTGAAGSLTTLGLSMYDKKNGGGGGGSSNMPPIDNSSTSGYNSSTFQSGFTDPSTLGSNSQLLGGNTNTGD